MTKITIYTAQEVEITEPKFYLFHELTGWAFKIIPGSNDVWVTSQSAPFRTSLFDVHYSEKVDKSVEITEARFYEIVATNYHGHLNELAKMAQYWQLEIHALKEFNEEQMTAQVKYDEGRDLINEARRERELETADRNPSDWSV